MHEAVLLDGRVAADESVVGALRLLLAVFGADPAGARETVPLVAQVLRERGEAAELVAALAEATGSITPRERSVLRRRYGTDGGSTESLEEIAAGAGVTRERVRQLVAKAERKLRHPVRARLVRAYARFWCGVDAYVAALRREDAATLARLSAELRAARAYIAAREEGRRAELAAQLCPRLASVEDSLGRLALSPRAHNALFRAGMRTVGALARLPFGAALEVRGLGPKSLREVLGALACYPAGGEEGAC